MESTKDKKLVRAGILCLVLAIITFALICSTFAKYVTQGSFEDQARVAKWGINVEQGAKSLFDASYKNADGSYSVRSEDGDNVVAPGTEKAAELMLINVTGNAPEVLYDFDVNLTITDKGDSPETSIVAELDQLYGWHWQLWKNGNPMGEYKTHSELELAAATLSQKEVGPNALPNWMNPGKNAISVGWKWDFYHNNKVDEQDTRLGDMAADGLLDGLTVNLNVKATQVLQANEEEYTVSFNTNGGSMNPPAQTHKKKGDKVDPVADPTKKDETFVGWKTIDGTMWDFDNDEIQESMTLYAAYDPKIDLDPSLEGDDIKIDRSKTTQELHVTAGSGGAISAFIKSGEPRDVVDIVPMPSNASSKSFALHALKNGTTVLVIKVDATGIYAPFEKEVDIEVVSHEMIWVSPQAKDLTYTGVDQSLVSQGVVLTPDDGGANIFYALSDSSTVVPGADAWGPVVPAGNAAGTYYVWWQIIPDAQHQQYDAKDPEVITVTIADAAVQYDAPTKAFDQSAYDEKAHNLVNAGQIKWPATGAQLEYALGTSDSTAPDKGWSTAVPQGTDASTYYPWYKITTTDKSLKPVSAKSLGTVEIKASDVVYTEPKHAFDQSTYDGKAYPLLKAGSIDWPTSGTTTMQYAVTDSDSKKPLASDWKTSIPTAENAGEYHTWYRIITTDKSINPVDTTHIGKTVIDKAESPMTWSDAKTITKNTDFSASAITADELAEATDAIGAVTYSMGENKKHEQKTEANFLDSFFKLFAPQDNDEADENGSYSSYFEFNSTTRKLGIKANANLQYVDVPITAYDPGDANHNDKSLTCTYTWKVELPGYDKVGNTHTKLKEFTWADMKDCAAYLENTEVQKKKTEFDGVYNNVVKTFNNDGKDGKALGYAQKGITKNGSDNATQTIEDNHFAIDKSGKTATETGFSTTNHVEFRLIGVLQDQKSDGTGAAAFSFMATHGLGAVSCWSGSAHNTWLSSKCTLKTDLQSKKSEPGSSIPPIIIDDAVEVQKYCTKSVTALQQGVSSYDAKVWIPSCFELAGTGMRTNTNEFETYARGGNRETLELEGTGAGHNEQYQAFSYIGYKWDDTTNSPLANIFKNYKGAGSMTGAWLRTASCATTKLMPGVGADCYMWDILGASGSTKNGRLTRSSGDSHAERANTTVTPCFCL